MKEYFNKHLNFKFYTSVEQEENGNYGLWVHDSNKRKCDYYSGDIVLYLAKENKTTKEEMQNILGEELANTTDFITFMDSFCCGYDILGMEEINTDLNYLAIEQDYNTLSTQEKINLWYELNDIANIFGDFAIVLI